MVLAGRLSNHDLTTRLDRLGAGDWSQSKRRQRHPVGVAPDGRRRFGSLRDAILEVLATSEHELSTVEIHRRVEGVIGETVSYGAVKAYLWGNSRAKSPMIEQGTGRGRYCSRG